MKENVNNKRKGNVVKRPFTINDCPMWLWKEFTKDINRYNDCYWVKLMELHRKAEMYDYITSTSVYPFQDDIMKKDHEFETKNEPEEKLGVPTMGGFQEYSPQVQDRIRKTKKESKEDE